MKLVREHIDFKRGENPHKSLKLGEHRGIQIGDKFKVINYIFWTGRKFVLALGPQEADFVKGTIFEITDVVSDIIMVQVNNKYMYTHITKKNLEQYFIRV